MDYIIEKETEKGFVFVTKLCNIYFDELKNKLNEMFGKSSVTMTDIDSETIWCKPYANNDVYRITCLDK